MALLDNAFSSTSAETFGVEKTVCLLLIGHGLHLLDFTCFALTSLSCVDFQCVGCRSHTAITSGGPFSRAGQNEVLCVSQRAIISFPL